MITEIIDDHDIVPDIDADTLIRIVKFLKQGKAPGLDNIHNEVLRLGTTISLFHHSGGSRPGHRVSGTQPKFPNLNENGQKSYFCDVFLIQNPVNILARSAIASLGTAFYLLHTNRLHHICMEISYLSYVTET